MKRRWTGAFQPQVQRDGLGVGRLSGMKAYSVGLRQRVIAACDAGKGTEQVATTFGVRPAWVRRLKQHPRERGDIAPRRAAAAVPVAAGSTATA